MSPLLRSVTLSRLTLACALCALAFTSAAAAAEKRLVFWHNQTGLQARFVERLVEEFNARHGGKLKLRGETGLELESTLMSRIDSSIRPDLLLLPSDMMGQGRELKLVTLPETWSGLRALSSAPIEPQGIPILQGNQLYLFYNKALVAAAPLNWEQIKALKSDLSGKGVETIGWPYSDPYYFLPFLQAFGPFEPAQLETPAMTAAVKFYRELATSGIIRSSCGRDCNTSRFYQGKTALAISGDWAISEAKAKLKGRFGIAPLPRIADQRPLIPVEVVQYLVFPNQKSFAEQEPLLRKFAEFLLSEPVQRRWMTEAERVPALASLQAAAAAHFPRSTPRAAPKGGIVRYSWIALHRGLELTKTTDEGVAHRMQETLTSLLRSEEGAR